MKDKVHTKISFFFTLKDDSSHDEDDSSDQGEEPATSCAPRTLTIRPLCSLLALASRRWPRTIRPSPLPFRSQVRLSCPKKGLASTRPSSRRKRVLAWRVSGTLAVAGNNAGG